MELLYRDILVLAVIVYGVTCVDLPNRERIALDTATSLLQNTTIVALCGKFLNSNAFYLQSWIPTDEADDYIPEWQVLITPNRGDGSKEILHLKEEDFYKFNASSRLGVMNHDKPGPIKEAYDAGGLLKLSKDQMTTVDLGSAVTFTDLPMPYKLLVHLCSSKDCSDNTNCLDANEDLPETTTATYVTEPINTTEAEETPVYKPIIKEEKELWIHTDQYQYGMLAWNIVLSLCVLLLVIALTTIFGRVEKLERRINRYERHENYYQTPVNTHSTGHDNGHANPENSGNTRESWNSPGKSAETAQPWGAQHGDAAQTWGSQSSDKALQGDFEDTDTMGY